MAEKLLLIDASSNIFRAFYALPALSNRAGLPTNAILGFVNMLQKSLRESRPAYVVVVWDSGQPARRKELYADYKATRDATPDDLRALLPGAVLVTIPEVRATSVRVGRALLGVLGGLILIGIFGLSIAILGVQLDWWGQPEMISFLTNLR